MLLNNNCYWTVTTNRKSISTYNIRQLVTCKSMDNWTHTALKRMDYSANWLQIRIVDQYAIYRVYLSHWWKHFRPYKSQVIFDLFVTSSRYKRTNREERWKIGAEKSIIMKWRRFTQRRLSILCLVIIIERQFQSQTRLQESMPFR